jgi:hypothetical protein
VVALAARFGTEPPRHQISMVSAGGGYIFHVDETKDGRHTYEAHLSGDWLLSSQHESGILSEKDWRTLSSLQRCAVLPKDGWPQLEDPAETWGVMQREDQTLVLRYAEWWEVWNTQVNVSYHRLVFKQKASL